MAPEVRGRGVGSALFRAAERWTAARGGRWIAVETQNVDVPACRFHTRRGCTLVRIDRRAHPAFPDEARLVWSKALPAASG